MKIYEVIPCLYENGSNYLIIFMLHCVRNHEHGGYLEEGGNGVLAAVIKRTRKTHYHDESSHKMKEDMPLYGSIQR